MADKKDWARLVAKSIFYASIQASIGSVEMSSKFSVINFSKDQVTLQRAADALRNYIIIGVAWTVGTMLALYANYGNRGIIVGLVANMVMMGWIVASYLYAFKQAAQHYNLEYPQVASANDIMIGVATTIIIAVGAIYFSS